MRLKNRLACAVVLFMSAFVASYSAILLNELPERADAETVGSLPWVLSLLPGTVNVATHEDKAALAQLVDLVGRLGQIRHVKVALYLPHGELVASTPSRSRQVPAWLSAKLSKPGPSSRKNVMSGERLVAYFEVSPALNDELAEFWKDFLRSSVLIAVLSMVAMALIVWSTFRALAPLDLIGDGLRSIAAGQQHVRLPSLRSPDLDEMAMAFNRMADALASSHAQRQILLRKLVDSDENTRRAVAHDLHDEFSPYLVALQPLVRTLQLQCARRPELTDMAATVNTMIGHQSHILAKLRTILMGLHPPELETLGLRGAIERLAAQAMHNRKGEPIEVSLQTGGPWRSFGSTIDVSIYRMMQECLTNVQRHGQGSQVQIVFNPHAELAGRKALAIDVINDCLPGLMDARIGGLGILGMRDRCIALGGSLQSDTEGDGKWRTRIRLPIDEATDI